MSNALKLGTQTGSLVNHVTSGYRDKAPEVGDGATILGWSDRRAATVVEVSESGKRIGIVEDIATRVDSNGVSEIQEYTFAPGDSSPQYFTLRKNGAWVREGESMKGGQRVKIGARNHYYDFSF